MIVGALFNMGHIVKGKHEGRLAFKKDSADNVTAFLRAYGLGTLPDISFPGNRTWRHQPLVFFNIRAVNGQIWLDFIGCHDPGRGHGSRGLKWLCALADQHHVTLSLTVFRPPNLACTYPTNAALKAWYQRNGFRPLGPEPVRVRMIRLPFMAI